MTGLAVSTISKKIRDDFSYGEQGANWQVIKQGPGMTLDWATPSAFRILTGTTANSETVLRYSEAFEAPVRVMFLALGTALLSQRIANQEFEFRLISADGKESASWLFDGTVATTAKQRSGNNGVLATDAPVTIPTSATSSLAMELELFIDECYWHARSADSVTARANSYVRNRRIPDPKIPVYVEIVARNLSTAPASSTTLALDAVTIQDINELTAEITGGRGGGADSQAMPMRLTSVFGNLPVSVASSVTVATTSLPSQTGGTTVYRNKALTNTDLAVKTAAGNVYWVYANNPNAADAWIHLYNALIANVTVGSTMPVLSFKVPANNDVLIPASPLGLATFGTAITVAATTSPDELVATAPAVGLFCEVGYA